jgi:hypothetical protein
MDFQGRSFLTETPALHQNTPQNFVAFLISNRTSAQHITLKPMEPVNAQINRWNNTFDSSAEHNKITGIPGYHLRNTPKILGPQQ